MTAEAHEGPRQPPTPACGTCTCERSWSLLAQSYECSEPLAQFTSSCSASAKSLGILHLTSPRAAFAKSCADDGPGSDITPKLKNPPRGVRAHCELLQSARLLLA